MESTINWSNVLLGVVAFIIPMLVIGGIVFLGNVYWEKLTQKRQKEEHLNQPPSSQKNFSDSHKEDDKVLQALERLQPKLVEISKTVTELEKIISTEKIVNEFRHIQTSEKQSALAKAVFENTNAIHSLKNTLIEASYEKL